MKLLGFFLGFINICLYTEAYKILVIFPFPVRSLGLLGDGFVKNLLDAGHEVTYITPYPVKNQTANLNVISINNTLKLIEGWDLLTLSHVIENGVMESDLSELQMFAYYTASMVFENEDVKKFLLDRNQKFDAVISDLYECEVFAGLAAVYDCPMIWSYSMGAHAAVLRLIDERTNPAYTADYLSPNIPPFTFTQRLQELWAQIKWTYLKRIYTQPKEEKLYRDAFEHVLTQRGRVLPQYEELIYNASLIFANDHYAYGNIPSLPGNFRFIAGQHVAQHHKPLTKDLEQIIAKNKVIYFSMGSTWKSKTMPEKLIKDLLKMFGELKQTVLWKFEADLENVPDNVHILHWAPQPGILAHPNLLCYISHGGQLSSIEAVHFGVPVIGVPVYFDQFLNINKAVAAGYALLVKLDNDLPEQLRLAINIMENDPTYLKRAKEVSLLFHERPVSPSAELVYWVKHVVKTRGAPHLRSPALRVLWYQRLYLDLAALVTIALAVIMMIVKKVFSFVKPNRKVPKQKRS